MASLACVVAFQTKTDDLGQSTPRPSKGADTWDFSADFQRCSEPSRPGKGRCVCFPDGLAKRSEEKWTADELVTLVISGAANPRSEEVVALTSDWHLCNLPLPRREEKQRIDKSVIISL